MYWKHSNNEYNFVPLQNPKAPEQIALAADPKPDGLATKREWITTTAARDVGRRTPRWANPRTGHSSAPAINSPGTREHRIRRDVTTSKRDIPVLDRALDLGPNAAIAIRIRRPKGSIRPTSAWALRLDFGRVPLSSTLERHTWSLGLPVKRSGDQFLSVTSLGSDVPTTAGPKPRWAESCTFGRCPSAPIATERRVSARDRAWTHERLRTYYI